MFEFDKVQIIALSIPFSIGLFITFLLRAEILQWFTILLTPKLDILSRFAEVKGGEFISNDGKFSNYAKIPIHYDSLIIHYSDSDDKEYGKIVATILLLLSVVFLILKNAGSSSSSSVAGYFGGNNSETLAKFYSRSNSHINFRLHEASLYDRFLESKMGMQDIKIGNPNFDDTYIHKLDRYR